MTEPSQDTTSWHAHLRASLVLGLPLIGAQLASVGLGVTDTIMLGWLGAEPLAASVLGTTFYFLCFLTGAGIAHAVAPIVANALGAGDDVTVRRSVRMAIWAVLIFAILCLPLLLNAEPIFLALGQVPELAALADDYLDIACWALAMNLFHTVLRSYLSAFERAGVVLYATLLGLGLNAMLNYMFIFGNWGAPALGIQGAAVATLGTNTVITIALIAYVMWLPELRKYTLFVRFWRPDWGAFAEVLALGWPISLTLLAEVSLFSLSSVMIGWIGTIELAAHGIALQISSVVFMVPLGLSFVATVRVGRAAGRADWLAVHRASVTVMILATGVALLAAAVLLIFPDALAALFLDRDNPDFRQIVSYCGALLAVAALFQVADTLQVVAAGMLRGIKDTRVPMMIAVASYIGAGIFFAYGLGFWAGLGGVGVWLGLAIGLALAAVLLLWRYVILYRRLAGRLGHDMDL